MLVHSVVETEQIRIEDPCAHGIRMRKLHQVSQEEEVFYFPLLSIFFLSVWKLEMRELRLREIPELEECIIRAKHLGSGDRPGLGN